MRIADSDDMVWKAITCKSFYVGIQDLKDRHRTISADYDRSTAHNNVVGKIKDLKDMVGEILKMNKFCKQAHPGPDTDEFKKSLKSMFYSCKEMIKELEKYL